MLIDSDAHSTTELGLLRWGVLTARRAWLEPADVWNTRDVDAFRNGLRRHRRPAAARDGTGAMTVDETLARLKALYFETTQATIEDAFDEAIDLLKTLPSDDERERAAVYMEGLAEMRQEWRSAARPKPRAEETEAAAPRSTVAERRRERWLLLPVLLPLDHLLGVEAERLGHVAVDGRAFLTSRWVMRGSRWSEIAAGVFGFFTSAAATASLRIHDRFIEIVRSTSSETLAMRANASTSVWASLGLLSTAAAIIRLGSRTSTARCSREPFIASLRRCGTVIACSSVIDLLRLGLDRDLVAGVDERRVGVLGRDLRRHDAARGEERQHLLAGVLAREQAGDGLDRQ